MSYAKLVAILSQPQCVNQWTGQYYLDWVYILFITFEVIPFVWETPFRLLMIHQYLSSKIYIQRLWLKAFKNDMKE